MNDEALDAAELVRQLRARFPEEAARTDAWLAERLWDADESPDYWVEAFADRTTEAIREDDWRRVKEHTEFFAAQYRAGSERIRSMVDVSYAENLMGELNHAKKLQAWPYIAEEVRALYEQMWGAPHS